MLHELLPELERSVIGALHSHMLPELCGVISLCDTPVDGMLLWKGLMDMAENVGPGQLRQCGEQLQFDDPINIQYTSGTTGFPKGAALSHYNILNNGYMVGESLKLSEHDRLVIPVPFYLLWHGHGQSWLRHPWHHDDLSERRLRAACGAASGC